MSLTAAAHRIQKAPPDVTAWDTNSFPISGPLIVASQGGEPTYTPLFIDDPDSLFKDTDFGFGMLTFDGTQAYFMLDGQHRLKAIKDVCRENPDIGKEDICVLIITHYDMLDTCRR